MRTVTFSDAKTAQFINRNFVAAWKNRSPGFHNCDLRQERQIHQDGRCFPTKNIVTFILTPDLKVIHYMTGYYHPTLFRVELEMALAAVAQAFDADFQLKPDGLQALRDAHRRHQQIHDIQERRSPSWSGSEFHRYLSAVHRHLSTDLAEFAALETNHEVGNQFAEDISNASRVVATDAEVEDEASEEPEDEEAAGVSSGFLPAPLSIAAPAESGGSGEGLRPARGRQDADARNVARPVPPRPGPAGRR